MPIRPENKHRYPDNWKLISKFVRFIRAKNKCEWCGLDNYAVGYRDEKGIFHRACGSGYHECAGYGRSFPDCEKITYKEARFIADELNESEVLNDVKWIVIVLTTAHIFDDRPEASSLLNLAALCQRCHNVHDMPMRQANRKKNIETNQMELI